MPREPVHVSVALRPVDPRHAARCPLVATDAVVRVTGLVAEYDITQRFLNTAPEPLEAVVRLPLAGARGRRAHGRAADRRIDLLAEDPAGRRDEILRLALAHGILTPHTALVAVDRDDAGTGRAPPPPVPDRPARRWTSSRRRRPRAATTTARSSAWATRS